MKDKVLLLIIITLVILILINKDKEVVNTRPNYVIEQLINRVDGRMELTTNVYYRDHDLLNIKKIYTNTVEIPSAYSLNILKEFEYNKTNLIEYEK